MSLDTPVADQQRLNRAEDFVSRLPTPFLAIDQDQIAKNYGNISSVFSHPVGVYYSLKANGSKEVIEPLAKCGSGFDIASVGELNILLQLGVNAERITFSAPVKIPRDIEAAYKHGVRVFAYDHEVELQKLAKYAPGSAVVLRVIVPNRGSRWPLTMKFGARRNRVIPLLHAARDLGLIPHGLTFHVGSQCERTETWAEAIALIGELWQKVTDSGLRLSLLNLGGGLPAQYSLPVPGLDEIGRAVSQAMDDAFPAWPQVIVEPGRAMVANAGVLATTVISKQTRGGKTWAYLDASVYAGLFEAVANWPYRFVARNGRPESTFTLAGPTCDSTDVIARGVRLPDLEVGDQLFVLSAGAYTTAYARYNGFDFPRVVLV